MADSIDRLHKAVLATRDADPTGSRTARLLRSGRGKIAKKVAEEAAEVVIEAMTDHHDNIVRESADLVYNLTVLWASVGVKPAEVWAEMERRERLYGIAEKLAKNAMVKSTRKRNGRNGRADRDPREAARESRRG
ncbi:Phosphoribosyl-ATP pyrophosphatase [Rhodovulum sp. PH10]|uniref:phosphoribosyl-ATP diphosphatase n=1 Tax=Rhodovulum sp. PH10 TaxID=1187851 RepID=UPI00027C201C|nr:phosphoribosyl-ATP diphosphatase [Rhodovulum sp. PH10]EJW11951.1 Phosphoribosyl-ATP pyrophosphatase [Rhodovulum sp. PH10]